MHIMVLVEYRACLLLLCTLKPLGLLEILEVSVSELKLDIANLPLAYDVHLTLGYYILQGCKSCWEILRVQACYAIHKLFGLCIKHMLRVLPRPLLGLIPQEFV